jgi:hypothetical protein
MENEKRVSDRCPIKGKKTRIMILSIENRIIKTLKFLENCSIIFMKILSAKEKFCPRKGKE